MDGVPQLFPVGGWRLADTETLTWMRINHAVCSCRSDVVVDVLPTSKHLHALVPEHGIGPGPSQCICKAARPHAAEACALQDDQTDK